MLLARTPTRFVRVLAAAALVLAACDQSPRFASDPYDSSKMDLKPSPAKLSAERHQGAFAEGSFHWIDAQPPGSVKASAGH